jgi:hypothetical protein
MGVTLSLLATVVLAAAAQAPAGEKEAERYGIRIDPDHYPQGNPKEALASVVTALSRGQFDYLLAQLADPQYVDEQVQKAYGGKFGALVEDAAAKYASDPGVVKKFRRYLNEGTWDIQESSASAQLKDTQDQVFLRRIGTRWFVENRNRPPARKEK